MINWKKISKPVLTVTVLGATALYGGSAIGQSRLGFSSQQLSLSTANELTLVATDACSAAQDSTAAAEKAYASADAAAGSATDAFISAAVALHDLRALKAPGATKAELDAAQAKIEAAATAEDKADKARDDAQDALDAARKSQDIACASGPGYLPNPNDVFPDNPIIQAMPTAKPKSSGGSS